MYEINYNKAVPGKVSNSFLEILMLRFFYIFCQLFRVNENMDVVIIRHFNSELASNDHCTMRLPMSIDIS